MDRGKSIEVCGRVLAAVKLLLATGYYVDGEDKVKTETIAQTSGLAEKQVEQAIEVMTRGRHPQVDGDRYGVWRINNIRHTY